MTRETLSETDLYFQARGLRTTAPKSLDASMRRALDTMRAVLYGPTVEDLTSPEQNTLRSAGLDLNERTTPDPLLETAAKYAAILESSLTPTDAAQRMAISPGRLRQLIADRSVYSIRLEGRRFVPIFQFQSPEGTRLVPNIGQVNRALTPDLHPVEVLNWYTTPSADLYIPSQPRASVSPLDWLKGGGNMETLRHLAAHI